jgi:glycosyltransferase involved in cell wall biosynthesis
MPTPIVIATILRPEGETGVQTHFQALASWLARSPGQVRIVTPFDAPKYLLYPLFGLRKLIYPLHTTASVWWYRHWHRVLLRRTLAEQLADGAPCIVYAQCPLSAQAALQARQNTAQRVVMVVHFNVSQADEWAGKGLISATGRLYQAIATLEASLLPQLDGIVYVSEFMRRELIQRIPAVAQVPSEIIPNFLADPGELGSQAPHLDHLICIGTLEPRKNQRYALQIIAATKALGTPLRLTLVGDGPDRAALKAMAAELGIEQLVRFAGYVPQAASLMVQHRAYLHVAQIENCPFVLIEAMSRGLPVFAPATGGVPETFNDGVEGRFIPLDDATQAAQRLLDWFAGAHYLPLAAQAARVRFLERFEADKTAGRLADFLQVPALVRG